MNLRKVYTITMCITIVSATQIPTGYTCCRPTELEGIYTCRSIVDKFGALFDYLLGALYYVDGYPFPRGFPMRIDHCDKRFGIRVFDSVVELVLDGDILASAMLPFQTNITCPLHIREVDCNDRSVTVLASQIWVIAKLMISEK